MKNTNRNSRDDKSKAGNARSNRRPAGKETFRTPSAEGEKQKKTTKPGRNNYNDSRPGIEDARPFAKSKPAESKRVYVKKDVPADRPFSAKRPAASKTTDSRPFRKRAENPVKRKENREERNTPTLRSRKNITIKDDGLIRLNRYIANAGICSRRKADEFIEAGLVTVNQVLITELGHKVDPAKDEVRYNGELLKREKKVYVLLNKPKDYITTTDDPQERKTVMQLIDKASRERIYPVGRLDRNTTGLLLMTNDGELADKLSHPKHGITKIYHVELNKNLSQGDFNKIQFGLELEDGPIKPDNISYVAGASKKEIGIQIHSGKNRIVRRIFEHLGYDVIKLDRVVYGNLTKKDLPRGRWRYLTDQELIQIKHLIK